MTPLPIDPLLPEIIARLRDERRLVLVAPPGAGKTTRVPAALVDAGVLSPRHPALILLQPRRVAARAAARRIAEERGWELGREVGYHIRFERRLGTETRVRVLTEGILNRQLVADPFLEGIGAVVLDEWHERSLHTDLALALLNEIRESVRDDLVIVVMSATMDADPVARFLGGCPILQAEGRAFPVALDYRPEDHPASSGAIVAAVEALDLDDATPGDILVFLPGAEEIRRADRALAALAARRGWAVLPLHGSLTAEEQDRALRPSVRRKLILATNIAETSLTIDGVTTVIDSGLARQASYDPARGLDRLELARISRASATQRAGRAGRTAAGRCVRLWSEGAQRGMAEADVPEVRRVDLDSTALALHAWGLADPGRFAWFEAPPDDRLAASDRVLTALGALENGRITPLGHQLLALPVHPRLGRLLIASAHDGYPRAGAGLAALVSEKDIVPPTGPGGGHGSRPAARGSSDLLIRLDRLDEAERARFSPALRDRGIDPIAARRVAQVRDDLLRVVRRFPGARSSVGDDPEEELMLRWVLLAYPDRLTRRRGGEATGVMVGGRGIRLAAESVVRDAEFFVALDPREDRRGGTLEAKVRIASAVRVEWLDELFPDALRRARTVEFDADRRRVVGVSTVWYRDLPLREDRNATVDPTAAAEALATHLRPEAEAFFAANDAASTWLARLDLLRRAVTECDWPVFDRETLGGLLDDVCAGCRGLDDVAKVALVPFLRAKLIHLQARMLDEEAPEALTVPSGNRIRLTYELGRPPVLAVRLQELFGWSETPRIAGGRVAVVLHVLGPNFRPVQITDDLKSFWATTYFQVRKDLRARYPKHSWPDDPLSARPEAKGSRRSGNPA